MPRNERGIAQTAGVCAVGSVFNTPGRGETFRVDYLVFSLIVLAVLAVVLYLIRLPGEVRLTGRPTELAERAQKRRKQHEARSPVQPIPVRDTVLQRELKKVPTPWGWPGSDARQGRGSHGNGSSLKEWMEHLVAEKRTVDDDYRQLKREALRSMVEDRFGHAARPGEMPYRKVKPPRLQDPNRPPDQMDNFPSGRTNAIVKGLSRTPGKPRMGQSENGHRKTAGLDRIKKPWGW